MNESKFWDLGEEDIIRPSKNSLYKIMNALIQCSGSMLDSHGDDHAVCFRISLPLNTKVKFEFLSGFMLSEPPTIQGQ